MDQIFILNLVGRSRYKRLQNCIMVPLNQLILVHVTDILIDKIYFPLKDLGDGKGTAKFLLDKIAEMEGEAQKSFMHR